MRLSGALDVDALERAFAAVVDRHETLRTRFAVVDGAPVQVIAGAGTFRLVVEEFSDRPDEEERQALARRRAGVIAGEAFDLERGPLLRAHLLRLSGEEHIAVVVMHHIVSDGWSIAVLIREVGTPYAAFVEGRPSPLPALPIQYADYALWQRGWLQGEVLAKQVGYWRERLSGAPAALDLPTDRPRPAVQSFRGASISVELPKELIDGLLDLARSEGATRFMVMVAAFQVLLSRWSGQTDVVVGTPVAGRTHRQVEGLIGFFVNMLALRTDLSGDSTFRSLLGQVRETALGAYAHQDLPFEKLVAELQPVRDLSRRPIFQVMINSFLEETPPSLALPGLNISTLAAEEVSARFELMLRLLETTQGVICRFEYATDLFDGTTIERLAGQFRKLMEEIVGRPEAHVSELELLGPAERRQLLEWSTSAADYLSPEYIGALAAEATLEEGAAPTELLSAMRAYVLDDWLGLAPVGVFGELYVGGVELRGSVGQPGLTAGHFLPDPFGGGARVYRTGKLARWRADGVLELVDRAEREGQAVTPAARAYEAPRTPLEEEVARIWSEMLGVERIGVHDNFFILGGHSLLATRVIARLREAFQVELPLRALFEAPRMGELSERVEMLCWAKWATETKAARSDQTEEIGLI
jgi:acyl carrier protein